MYTHGFFDPEIIKTFGRDGHGFRSCSIETDGVSTPSPLWTIARVAQHRVVAGVGLDLSPITPGYEDEVLGEYESRYGHIGVNVYVTPERARQFAEIGRQILALDKQGSIQPPLRNYEVQAIGHLIATVDQAAPAH